MPRRARRYIGIAGDIVAVDLDRALVDRHQPGDHVEAGRLAGAVRAEQADGLAGAHAQRHAVDDRAGPCSSWSAPRDQRALELRSSQPATRPAWPRRRRPDSAGQERRALPAISWLLFCDLGLIDIMTRPVPPPLRAASTWASPGLHLHGQLAADEHVLAFGQHDLLAGQDQHLGLHVERAAVAGGDLLVRLDVDLVVDLEPVDAGRAGRPPNRRSLA